MEGNLFEAILMAVGRKINLKIKDRGNSTVKA
jgi:hypothetical protein